MDLESSRSFQPDTDIVFETACHVLRPAGDDDEFPTKEAAGIAIYNERDGDHEGHCIVFQPGGAVVFQTALQASVLTTIFKPNMSPPNAFRLTSAVDLAVHIDVVLADADAARDIAVALAASCFKGSGCVAPVAFAVNKRESRRNASVAVGNVAVLDLLRPQLFSAKTLEPLPLAATKAGESDGVLKIRIPVSADAAAPSAANSAGSRYRAAQPDTLQLLLSDSNEGLVIAAACDPRLMQQDGTWPWVAECGLGAAEAGESQIFGFALVVTGSEEPEADAAKNAIKKRLQRQGAAAVLDRPASNTSFGAESRPADPRARGASTTHGGRSMDDVAAQPPQEQQQRPTDAEGVDPLAEGGRKSKRKSKKNRASEADELAAFLETGDDSAAATSSPVAPDDQVDVLARIGTGAALTNDEIARAEAKLEKKKQRLLRFEAELLTQQDDLRHREQLLETRFAEIRLAETALRAKQLEHSTALASAAAAASAESSDKEMGQPQAPTPQGLRRRERDRDRSSERSPLINSGSGGGGGFGGGDAAYVYKVEQNFFDNSLLPDAIFDNYPLSAWFVHLLMHPLGAALVVAICLAGLGLCASEFTKTWPAVIMAALCFVTFCAVFWRRRVFFDELHLIDQSCMSHADPVDVSVYAFPGLFAGLPILIVATALSSIAVVVSSHSVLIKIGLIFALSGAALLFGACLVLFLMTTYTCHERIAQTVPHQHGAITSRVTLRASLARYQYLKTLVLTASSSWTLATYMLLAVTLFGMLFAIYNVTLRQQDQLVSFNNVLLSICVFTAACVTSTLIVFSVTGWDEATRTVIGAVGTHLDRWSRGDLNHSSDARAEDFVTLQTALSMSIAGYNHARWALRLPLSRGARYVEVPRLLVPVMVALCVAGVVLIPIVAAYHVNNIGPK